MGYNKRKASTILFGQTFTYHRQALSVKTQCYGWNMTCSLNSVFWFHFILIVVRGYKLTVTLENVYTILGDCCAAPMIWSWRLYKRTRGETDTNTALYRRALAAGGLPDMNRQSQEGNLCKVWNSQFSYSVIFVFCNSNRNSSRRSRDEPHIGVLRLKWSIDQCGKTWMLSVWPSTNGLSGKPQPELSVQILLGS